VARANATAAPHALARVQMKKQGQQPDQNDAMLDVMADSQTVDIVPLIPALKPGGFISVTLYVDDKGNAKELPLNSRATALVSACGANPTDVLGDAFVARAYDNEAEDMKRLDFSLRDMEPSAKWFREAFRLKAVLVLTREGTPQDEAANKVPRTAPVPSSAHLLCQRAQRHNCGEPALVPLEFAHMRCTMSRRAGSLRC
jgi:hypothetical protein